MQISELSKQINWKAISNQEIVIVDVETTGLDKKKDKIIEIGAVRLRQGSDTLEKFSALLTIDEELPDVIIDLTGITDEMLKESGKPFYRVMGDFKTFLGSSDASAYNAKFDKAFIDNLCSKYNIPFKNYFSDTMLICRKAFKLSGMKLSDVVEHLNIPYEDAHRAVNDCEMTLKCHMAALIEIERNPDL